MPEQIATHVSSILTPQDWGFPVPIAYGPGRMAEIAEICTSLRIENPLIVTDKGSRDLPFIHRLQDYLASAGLTPALFSEISPNPRDDEIGAGRALYRQGQHDAIIAIGGGSGLDGGKAICLTANNEIDLWAFEFEQEPPELDAEHAFPPLICIPTTAGTGAETESTAMVTHLQRQMKYCIWHPDLKPALALLDPEITLELPVHLTAWTGADAMIHAIEAYTVPGFNPLCDALALEALKLVSKWLPVAVDEPQNLEARGAMMVGSCLAGISFTKGLGLVHAISHMIGAEFNTQHGLTNAVLLPTVLKFNMPVLGDKIGQLAHAMGLEDTSAQGLQAGVDQILKQIGIPHSLAEIGVPADCAQRIAEKALQDSAASTNPRPANVSEVRALIEQAFEQTDAPTIAQAR